MGRNIFVSYKYNDCNVQSLGTYQRTKVRDYVNVLENLLAKNGHLYYGEHDDEDLSDWSDEQIYSKLKDKIFPTSCTIVLISPSMKDNSKYDKSQWIPWEIYYSLRETPRSYATSRRNGILAVVLPDIYGCYNYMQSEKKCCPTGCVFNNTQSLFTILKKNMFNKKNPSKYICSLNDTIWHGESSYIPMVKWEYFVKNIDLCIERAEALKEKVDQYELHVSVNQ